jgi:hypothetical protein
VEVVEWLLLDGVYGQRTGLAIDFADEHAVKVLSVSAAASLAIGNATIMRTEQALHISIVQSLIIPALHLVKFLIQNTIAS